MRDKIKFCSVFGGILAAKSGLWKRSEWECLGALLCHETTYWWMRELTAKPQTGPRDSRGFCWATKRLLPAENMVPKFSGTCTTTQRANRCRRKSELELNLYLSLVYLWPQLLCFCGFFLHSEGVLYLVVLLVSIGPKKEEVLSARSRISIDMFLAEPQHSPLQILQGRFHFIVSSETCFFSSSIKSKVLKWNRIPCLHQ